MLSCVSPDEVAALRAVVAELAPADPERFATSLRDPDRDHRHLVDAAVRQVLEPCLRDRFPAYRSVACAYVVKPPGAPDGEVPMHQDWSFVDDHVSRSLGFWCPVQRVDPTNGCMQVVPGSHRLARQPRAAGTPFAFAHVEGRLRQHLQPVPLDAGQVLVYDHCLFHASGINHSMAKRTAVAAVLVPSRDPLRMYRLTSVAGVVDAFEVPDRYHLDHDPGEVPDDAVFLGSVRVRIEASAGG